MSKGQAPPDPRVHSLTLRRTRAEKIMAAAIAGDDMEGALVAANKVEVIEIEVEAMRTIVDREKDAALGVNWSYMPHGLKMP